MSRSRGPPGQCVCKPFGQALGCLQEEKDWVSIYRPFLPPSFKDSLWCEGGDFVAFVRPGCYNKMPRTIAYTEQELVFRSSGGWKVEIRVPAPSRPASPLFAGNFSRCPLVLEEEQASSV